MFPGKDTFDKEAAHLRIVVFGIPKWTRKKIFHKFARFGIITGISDVSKKGFAFVQYKSEMAVLEAMQSMSKKTLLGEKVIVKRDRKRFENRPTRTEINRTRGRPPKKEDTERFRTISLSSTSQDCMTSNYEQRSETSSRASSVDTVDISVSEECMSPTSCFGEEETDPPEPLKVEVEVEVDTVDEEPVEDDTNHGEIPMDICIKESSNSGSENSFHSDSTLDLPERTAPAPPRPPSRSQVVEAQVLFGSDASTQTFRNFPSPQWNRATGPVDCFVAQMVGTEEYGDRIKSLLTGFGIKHSDLYYENLSDAENPIMEYVEKSEALYCIFICDSDVKDSTISVFSESKLTKNLPLSEAIASLQKHFELIKVTSWNKFRVMKFFLNPMMSSLDGLSADDMQFAVQYVAQRNTFVGGSAPTNKRRSSCDTQARHDVPVFGQT